MFRPGHKRWWIVLFWVGLAALGLLLNQPAVWATPNTQLEGRYLVRRAEIAFNVTDPEQALVELEQLTHLVHGRFAGDGIKVVVLAGEQREIKATLELPPEMLDTAMARLRGMAWVVFRENIEGQDVSSQLSALQDRLERLRAARRQLRDLLDQAETTAQRQQIERNLADVETEIADVEASLAELQQQIDWARIDILIHQAPPTPTPSLAGTPTPSLTGTATSFPLTPAPTPWRPGETARQARHTLGAILRVLGDMLIAVGIVGGPFLIAGLVGWWVLKRLSR